MEVSGQLHAPGALPQGIALGTRDQTSKLYVNYESEEDKGLKLRT